MGNNFQKTIENTKEMVKNKPIIKRQRTNFESPNPI